MKVKKPWGHEIRWALTEKYIGKILRIEPGQKLSRQYHNTKDETIYILYGTLSLEIGQNPVEEIILKSTDTYRIFPGLVHRFCAKWGDVDLIEVSTPELNDVVRLEDEYQRN